jgi:signal transduction histidine kinase
MEAQESWIRPLAAAVVALVVIATLRSAPTPGAQGRSLVVAVVLIVFVAAMAGVLFTARSAPAVQLALMITVATCAGALLYLQPRGPGFVGVVPVVSGAAFRLPTRWNIVIVAVAVGVVGAAYVLDGTQPVWGIVLNELAIVGFYLVSTFARRYRENNERTEQLLAELKETRQAQALAATLAERQRLAREMHDVLAHSLSGLVLNLEGARLLAEKNGSDTAVDDALERAQRMARSGLEEARRAIGMLRDDVLPGPDQLADLATSFETDTGVECRFESSGDARELSTESRLTFYRVAQEALTNIKKHASARHVELRLAYEPSVVRLDVENIDDGERSAPGLGGSGYGLTGMRERAELLGGTLTAGPTDRGFIVHLEVPG